MRLLPVSLLCLFSSIVVADTFDQSRIAENVPGEIPLVKDEAAAPTIFDGVSVPQLPEINGEIFDKTVAEGYWFVKHHSPWCPHCVAIAPTWQTLYEYYYASKPVPSGASADTASTSMNTFTAYYNFHFGSLNCVAFGTTCNEHGVSSFPIFVLYLDGKEQKRFEGTKDMKGLSDFIENVLETIKPGSRPLGGPALPKVGDKVSPQGSQVASSSAVAPVQGVASTVDDLIQATAAPVPTAAAPVQAPVAAPAADALAKEKLLTDTTPTIAVEEARALSTPLQATQVKKNKKPTATPNPLGISTSFTAESFQTLVTMTHDPWFIKFYAPWCGHCKAMAPNWIQLAKEMKGKLNIGEVNCDQEARLCKDVRLRGYPTILFFQGGERVEYDGLRGLGDFVTYANKAIDAGEGVRDVSAAEFKEMEESEEVIFVYFYDHATTSEDFAALEMLTLSLIGHAKLVKTNSAAMAERFKITTWPRLLVSRDGRPTYYTALAPQDMRDFRQVLHWMQSVWLPIVPELTASNSREIMDGKIVVLGILTRERPDEFMMAKKEMKQAAIEWMDREILNFQRERQELRDAKELRLAEAEDRNDQHALRAAKSIRINMDRTDHKEVGFAWVDGVFWERWIRTTYGIEVTKDGEKVIINDEDQRRYWDTTTSGNFIMASRTSILETIKNVVAPNPTIKPKSTISSFEKFFFDIRSTATHHPILSVASVLLIVGALWWGRGRRRRGAGGFGAGTGFFRLDEKDGLLGGPGGGGKVD